MVHLHSRDPNGLDTTVSSLTPLYSGKAILGGTFSHWSPIAALLWTGTPHPTVLLGLVQDQDDKSLFGTPIALLTDQKLFEYCSRLNITALVANKDDFQTRTMLDNLPHFQSYYNNGEFFVYRVKSYDPSWIESSNADGQLDSWADDEIRLSVNSAKDAANVEVKTFAYPLWQVETGNSQKLEATGDDLGLMRIDLPAGSNYYVIIRYEGGPIEQVSSLISWLSLTLFAVGGLAKAWKRR